MTSIPETATSLRTAISNLHKRLRKQMYTEESFSITELTTLSFLFQHDTLFPSQLADLVKVKTQSMSQVLNHLEERRLISRRASKEDKRKVGISLTAAGKKVVDKTRYQRDEWLTQAIEDHLSDREKKILAEALSILHKLADVE
jgi:DNA-binding MarR family transcriptional regulator